MNAAASARSCPCCCSRRVYRSHRRRPLDRVWAVFGGKLHRCQDCRERLVFFGLWAIPPRALTRALAAAAGFLLCLLAVWWSIGGFHNFAG